MANLIMLEQLALVVFSGKTLADAKIKSITETKRKPVCQRIGGNGFNAVSRWSTGLCLV